MYYFGLIIGNAYDDPLVLKAFHSIEELDQYTSQFNDSEEVRKLYDQDISEYMIDRIPLVKKYETKNNKQRGRICAFYFDKYGIDFLAVEYKNRHVVRDYHEIDGAKNQADFLITKLDKKISDIKRDYKYNCGREYARITKRYLRKYHFGLSDELMYFLAGFYNELGNDLNNPKLTEEDKKKTEAAKLLKGIKKRIKQLVEENYYYIEPEVIMETPEEFMEFSSDADEEVMDDYQEAVRTGNYDDFFKKYQLDDLNGKMNLKNIGRKVNLK